jgi:hemolysin III
LTPRRTFRLGRQAHEGATRSPLRARAGVAAALLMLAGGLLYTAGALSYHRRRPDPIPSVFGYHEVFHALVYTAATCQSVAIAVFIT